MYKYGENMKKYQYGGAKMCAGVPAYYQFINFPKGWILSMVKAGFWCVI